MGKNKSSVKDNLSVKEQVEQYMREKYNEEFTVEGGGNESWNSITENIYVSTPKFPGKLILIRRDPETGGMIDNYVDFLMKEDAEKVMDEIVQEVYPESKVNFIVGNTTLAGIRQDMSVDEYLNYCSKYINLSIDIFVYDPEYLSNKEEKNRQ